MSTNNTAPVGGAISGAIDTSAVLATAIERLNRQSVVRLLQQLVQEIDTHYSGVDTKINDAVAVVASDLSSATTTINGTLGDHQTQIDDIRDKANQTDTTLTTHINTYQTTLSPVIDAKIDAKTPGIVQQAIDAMTPQVQQIISTTLTTQSLDGTAQKIQALKDEIALVDAAAKSLDTGELAQVSTLLDQVLATKDLSNVVSSAMIPVNGTPVRFDKLLETLANQPQVLSLSLSYLGDDISGAVFTLSNQQQANFSATRRTEASPPSLIYEFKTTNLNGLPASFELKFTTKEWNSSMCGKQVSLTQYDAVYQSNVLFSLTVA